MNRYRTFKIAIIILIYCLSFKAYSQKESKWLGITSEKNLAKNFDWFRERYNNYKPDSSSIAKLKTILPEYTILVFAGVWCGDTKRILPQFFKTIDEANMPENNVTLYLLDEDKGSPGKLEKKYSITDIPTFIIFKKKKIEGKIEEADVSFIEKDLVNIISKVKNHEP